MISKFTYWMDHKATKGEQDLVWMAFFAFGLFPLLGIAFVAIWLFTRLLKSIVRKTHIKVEVSFG